MTTLFLDTASGQSGIAITCDGRVLAESLLGSGGRRQNSWLLPEIERLLENIGMTIGDIDLFGCASGPGSFTGLRTGIATVQGLSFSTNRPFIGVSSLAMLAMNIPISSMPVCPMMDARKGEVYSALYRCNGIPEPIIKDQAAKPEKILSQLTGPTLFIGDGALKYRETIEDKLSGDAFFPHVLQNNPRPSSGAILAEEAFNNCCDPKPEILLPNYLRKSEAELARSL